MNGQSFDVVACASAQWRHPGPAVAAARAGGIGLLDLAFCEDTDTARRSFDKLLAGASGRVGLRVTRATLEIAETLLDAAGDRSLTVLLTTDIAADAEAVEALTGSAKRCFWAEIDDIDALARFVGSPNALVARGHECGGRVGSDTSFILLQKLVAATSVPVFVHGGIGVHTAAAARVAGAAGVVLADQLLLMPESPLDQAMKQGLARLNGAETRLFGERLGAPYRVYGPPSSAALAEAEKLAAAAEAGELSVVDWWSRMTALIGWNEAALRPLGQDIGLASGLAARHRSTGRLVQAIASEIAAAIREAATCLHLAEAAPLAASHGTRYPLVQGPMTRVSDTAGFAHAVADNGVLPFLALALMRGDQVAGLLAETAEKMGDRPWGVGLLGFVPQQLREEQIAEIFKVKPPFALIAGGRPDQAAQFEARGIATYIHAPAPALLRLYLEQGARRFVFEGRECGGHIGPIASFALWEQMIEVLLADVPADQAADVHVLFAGGVHDGLSGAMLAALTAPLAARGIKVGALMGSAYLFTDEIVASGATVAGYRDQALACGRTVSLGTGPGHATRCSDTPFAQYFHDRRRALLAEGADGDTLRDALEDLNLGRLRMASKGRARDAEGRLTDYDADAQLRDGMYMIGQVATLNRDTFTLAELHERVSAGATAWLEPWAERESPVAADAAPCDIAIIGIGVLAPGASDVDTFWDNILAGRSTITEVPRSRWDWELYYDPDRSARDKVYSKWGGFIDETVFDPFAYGIPPMSMKSIDPIQLLALESCTRALADAGMADGNFDREHTSVILGAGGGLGDLGLQYGVRAELPRFVENPDDAAWDRLPEWGQESFSGSLLNVAAGRVANRLDLGGTNFTVDAACGSSLAAITLATQELETGRSNLVLAGGIDTVNGPFGFLCFSKTQALSPTGTPRAFDRDADGIVISEAAVVCVLKRLADAERDGDRIYATIRAAAGSSDGKALGMTAPRPEGQMRALHRAYAKAGLTPADIDLVEAHGTGTPVGDKAEAETITRVLREAGAGPRSVALGSIKTILGHTKAAAGVSGLVKTALALHHRTLPAHVGVEHPIDAIAAEHAPVHLPREPRPWLTRAGRPRRAAVSAFGFGGTNFHAVLEEYRDEITTPEVAGATRWPAELCVLRTADRETLATEIDTLAGALAVELDIGLAELAHGLAERAAAESGAPVGLAIVATDLAGLRADLQAAAAHLAEARPLPPNVRFSDSVPAAAPQTAFLFPGQGSQYLDMGREPALYLDDFRAAFELADRVLAADVDCPISRIVWPERVYDDAAETAQKQRLTDTRHAQPALGTVELGYLNLADRLGVRAEAAAGHSYGEYAALHAAGVIDASALLALSASRGRAMAEAGASAAAPGGMAAVRAARETIADRLAGFEGVTVANHNAPEETVISGPKAQVEAAVAALAENGIGATVLPVSGAFHTDLVAGAQAPLSGAIAATDFHAPRHPVYSNTLGAAYPDAPDEIRALLDRHMLSTVEFVEEIRAMYADGVRLFVELGPKSVVSRMAQATLAGHNDIRTVALDQRGGSLAGLLTGLGELVLAGGQPRLSELFAARGVPACDPKTLAARRKAEPPKTAWMVSGGCARPVDDPVQRTGAQPALDHAAKTAAIERAAARRSASTPSGADTPTARTPEAATTPAPSAAPQPASAATGTVPAPSAQALNAYHETMRQFLALQEKVMAQYLGGASPGAASNPACVAAMPQPPASAASAVPEPAAGDAPRPTAEPEPDPAPAEAATPGVDPKARLVATVAELTGYPEDMIGVDADLEADLGIDSIKRVEILGAFRKQLPQATSDAMQADMERFTAAKSIGAILEQLDAIGGASRQAVAAPAVEPSAPAADTDAKALLLATVSELTGYPEDMIGVDADLEADLGIDSIKRVEILGAFRKQLPQSTSDAMQADMECFTAAKSVSTVLAALENLGSGPAAPAEPAGTAVPAADPAAPKGPLPRFVVRSQPMPLDGEPVMPAGLVLLAGPAGESRDTLAERLAAAGATPVPIEATDAEAIAAAVEDARSVHGPVRGIVSLHGLAPGRADSLAGWQADGQRCVLTLFHLIQAAGDDIATARVFAATRLGGSLSRETTADGSPLAGGAGGLLKCLGREYPDATVRLVDFNGQTPASIGERLYEEYVHDDLLDECGYTGDARHGAVTVSEPLADTPFAPHIEPAADWVILATGGARGITADILARLAVPGCTLVLAGRSPEPQAEDPALAEAGDALTLKRVLAEQAKAAGEPMTSVQLEARAKRVLGAREIHANLARLREIGANVEYHAVDVRDEAVFGGLIDDLYARHGRLDAVLHGAGVIEDKLLADKQAESFARVFATKVDSAWILAKHLQPDTLKALCFFTSVAGRYGNAGQADYAAANEAVARLAWQLSREYPDARVLAINWGPWDAGMVTDGVKRQFEARGVTPIAIAAGVDYFADELAYGSKADVELVAGDGPWAAEQAVREAELPANPLTLVRSPLRMGSGGALVLAHHLDLDADPYLADHQLDGRPVLPATGAAEWIAQTVAAGWPDWQVAEIRGLRVLGGVVLDSDAGTDMTVSARASSHSGAGEQMVDVDIRQAGRQAACYRASVRLVERLDAPPVFDGEALAGEAVAPAEAYAKYLFHGPRFQLLSAIDAHAEAGIDARVRPSALADWLPDAAGHWLFDPGLLDCGPQLAMVWTRLYHDTSALPSAFGAITRYGHAPLPAALRLVFRLAEVGAGGATLRYDAFYVDADDRVRIALRDAEGTASAALNRLAGT